MPLHVEPRVRVDAAAGQHPAVADVHDRQRAGDGGGQRAHGEVAAESEPAFADPDRGRVGVDAGFVELVVLPEGPGVARGRQPGAREPGGDVVGCRVEARRGRVPALLFVRRQVGEVPGELLRGNAVCRGAHRVGQALPGIDGGVAEEHKKEAGGAGGGVIEHGLRI